MLDPVATTEAATDALSKVSPVASAFLIIVISFLGLMAWLKGERRGRRLTDNGGQDISGLLDAREDREERRKTNAILMDIAKAANEFNQGQQHTHRLLEAIMNNQEQRKSMAHSKGGGP